MQEKTDVTEVDELEQQLKDIMEGKGLYSAFLYFEDLLWRCQRR